MLKPSKAELEKWEAILAEHNLSMSRGLHPIPGGPEIQYYSNLEVSVEVSAVGGGRRRKPAPQAE